MGKDHFSVRRISKRPFNQKDKENRYSSIWNKQKTIGENVCCTKHNYHPEVGKNLENFLPTVSTMTCRVGLAYVQVSASGPSVSLKSVLNMG